MGLCCLLLLEEKARTEHVRRYIWVVKKEMDEMNDNELLANIVLQSIYPRVEATHNLLQIASLILELCIVLKLLTHLPG